MWNDEISGMVAVLLVLGGSSKSITFRVARIPCVSVVSLVVDSVGTASSLPRERRPLAAVVELKTKRRRSWK